MGAFLSGLIGKLGQRQEMEEQRSYEENRAERDRMRKLVEYAGEMAIQKGDIEALPAIYGELDELGKFPGATVENPFEELGKKIGGMFHRRKQQQQQQQQAQRADQQYQQITGQPPPGAPPAGGSPGGYVEPPPGIGTGTPFFTPAQAQKLQQNPLQAPANAPPGAQAPGQAAGAGVIPTGANQGTLTPPPGARPANVTPPMPAMPEWVKRYRQALDLGQQRAQAQKEQEFQTGRTHAGIEAGDLTQQQITKIKALSNFFQSPEGGKMDAKTATDEAERAVLGKALAPPAQKFAPFYINGAQIPAENQVDALGNPIDRQNGIYKLEESTGKFYPAASAPRAAGSDELTRMTKIILAKKGITKPTEAQALAATQEAGTDLFRNKVINPQERLDLQKNTVRTIVGESGVLQAPTHVPGAMEKGPSVIPFGLPGATPTPPMPAPREPVKRKGQPSATNVPRPAPAPIPWIPAITGAERGRKDNAEVIMAKGGELIANISKISREHPEWTGATGPTWQAVQKKFGTADPSLGTLQGSLEGLTGFLPALHGFRSGKVLSSWKETLDNPLRNPALTQNVIREAGEAARELRDAILKRNVGPMSMEEEERKAVSRGAGTTGTDLSKVPTDELLRRLAPK
jgi:hypothetical protein